MNNKNFIYAILIVAITVIFRLFNNSLHLVNFTPIIAVSLFAGSFFQNNKISIWIPIAVMFITDCYFQIFTQIPGFYGASQIANYAVLVVVALLGSNLVKPNLVKVGLFTIAGSLLFFIVSNLGVWAFDGIYTLNAEGLSQCFTMALPFYNADSTSMFFNSLFGNLATSLLLFGAYYLVLSKQLKASKI